MKQLLKEHEVKYIVRRRTKKELDFRMRTFEITPHGGYVEVRIVGFFSSSSAQNLIDKTVLKPPVTVDAGFEEKNAFNLIWNPTSTQNL